MNLVLNKLGSAYTFEITPAIVMSTEIGYKDSTSKRLEEKTVWNISGYFAPGAKSLKEQVGEFEEFINADYLNNVRLMDGSSVIEELSGEGNVRITNLSYPTGSGPQHATRRNFEITLEVLKYAPEFLSTGVYQYTIEYATEQSTLVTRTISGTIKDLVGYAVLDKLDALITLKGWAIWDSANLLSKSSSSNDENSVCSFSIVHKKYWAAFPVGTTNGEITRERSVDAQGVVKYKISGWFEGNELDCTAAIMAEKAVGHLLGESISRAPYSNRTNFNLELLAQAGEQGPIYYSQETLTIQEAVDGIVFKPVLGGGEPVKQTVARTTAKATQSGLLKGLTSWPPPPALHWSESNLTSKSVTRLPLESQAGLVGFGIQYNYQFEFSNTPSF
jgi:hypothetical protein